MVEEVRSNLRSRLSATVPYVCQISGKREELVVISEENAIAVADLAPEFSDSTDAMLAVSVLKTDLCICDLAILVGGKEDDVRQRLDRLVGKGVLNHRLIDEMNYFSFNGAFANGRLVEKIARLLK